MGMTNKEAFQILYDLKWRHNGHTYTSDDTYAFAFNICKSENINLMNSEIDIENQCFYIYGTKKGEKVRKVIPLKELEGYKSPYVKRDVYLIYKNREYLRKELELFCWEYIRRYYSSIYYDTFRVSHKTSELMIKYGTGILKKTVRVPLEVIEDILLNIVNLKQCIC